MGGRVIVKPKLLEEGLRMLLSDLNCLRKAQGKGLGCL